MVPGREPRGTGTTDAVTDPTAFTTVGRRRSGAQVLVILGGLGVLAGACLLSLFVGSGDIAPGVVVDALLGSGTTTDDLLVRDFRVPRTLLGLLAGLALGLAGVVMQALTRNPLADPGLLGVNAGAFFAVVVSSAVLGTGVTGGQVYWGILGAGVAGIVVYVIGSTGMAAGTPVKLVLAGVAVAAVLTGISRAITFANPTVFDRIRFWEVGSLQGRQMDSVAAVWVLILVASLVVLALARSLNALTMGEEVARGLGTNILAVRTVGFLAVTVLCGAATAVVGPISFVGLAIAFTARFVVGVDHRWIMAFCVVAGPALVLLSDVAGRVIVDSELPAGVVTAAVGAPILIVLVRRSRMRSL